ncbi:cupin domain-containing protein [Psychrobacter aestuarii]|uniref:Cupin domain-containing protein n=1 Tax=Psychrobacter aestuarii TaxID=556327 RepID=A0ABP3FB63_9GAMM|nr:cupin domain-containing protein [Psychrobacter aestuarii]
MTTFPLCLPDGITPEIFLRDYWQKKPLLIKQGLPQLANMFEPEDVLGLAIDEEANARLLTERQGAADGVWQMKKSPLDESDFDNLPATWTVLVQNMEQWSPELGALWQAFDYIPQWQRDDIMVSYAPKGGSVGKHYDDYDVFLAQGYGQRRWQLGKFCDETTEFVAGEPIRVFDDMGEIIFDEVLDAGDVLYVPPKLSHYGVAADDCLTFSFGCRRPNLMQIIDSFADMATNDPSLFVPMLLPQSTQPSGVLSQNSIDAMQTQLLAMMQSEAGQTLLRQAICEVVSKRGYDVLIPEEMLSSDEVKDTLAEGAVLRPDYSSRLLYTQTDTGVQLYANGQRLDGLDDTAAALLQRLADGDSLNANDVATLDNDALDEWLENGWIWLDAGE